jgi:hypothetical protein
LNRPRGKRLTLLIASVALAVLLGAAFASKDLILTTWYSHRLRSEDVEEQRAAIISLGQMRTKRSARILAAYLGDADSPIPRVAGYALTNMGEVAMEPLSEAFQTADDFAGRPKQLWASEYTPVGEMLPALLEIQRKEPRVSSLLENIGSRFTEREDDADLGNFKNLVWMAGVQPIEGKPCLIFLFTPTEFAGSQQTILITDAGGRVIAWKEVGGEPTFVSCELDTIDGELFLIVTCHEGPSVGRYPYRLTLRGIEEPR